MVGMRRSGIREGAKGLNWNADRPHEDRLRIVTPGPELSWGRGQSVAQDRQNGTITPDETRQNSVRPFAATVRSFSAAIYAP